MTNPIRVLTFALVFLAGLASILATSPLPPPLLYAVTQNNYEDEFYGYGAQAFACPGEEALLKWNAYDSGNPRLRAEPLDKVLPELDNKSVMRQGSLSIAILGDAELALDVGRDLPDGFLAVGLIPAELCTGFDFPLIGWYRGRLEQNSPEANTLERRLRLAWVRENGAELLRAELGANLSYGLPGPLKCDYLGTPDLVCTSNEGAETLKLELSVTEDGLGGTYAGTTALGNAFSGALVLQKQTGAPPQQAAQEAR